MSAEAKLVSMECGHELLYKISCYIIQSDQNMIKSKLTGKHIVRVHWNKKIKIVLSQQYISLPIYNVDVTLIQSYYKLN